MLIIEGPDMVGKTTLCKALVKNLNAIGYPHVYRWFSKLPACWDYYHDYIPNIAPHVVQDRFHLSEIMYRLARGETPRLHTQTYRLLDAKVRLVAGFTVVITATPEFLKRQWDSLKDREMHTLDQILKVNELFYDECITAKSPVMPRCDIDFHHRCITQFPAEDKLLIEMLTGLYITRFDHVVRTLARRNHDFTRMP